MKNKKNMSMLLASFALISCGRNELENEGSAKLYSSSAPSPMASKRLFIVESSKASVFPDPSLSGKPVAELAKGSMVIHGGVSNNWMRVESLVTAQDIDSLDPVWVHQSQLQCTTATLCVVVSSTEAANGRQKADMNSPIVRRFKAGGVVRVDDKSTEWLEVIGFGDPATFTKLSGWLEVPVVTQGAPQVGVVNTVSKVAGVRSQTSLNVHPFATLANGDMVVFRNTTIRDWVRVEMAIKGGTLPKVGPVWVHETLLDCNENKLCFVSSADGSANGRASASETAKVEQVFKNGGLARVQKQTGPWREVVGYIDRSQAVAMTGWMPRQFLTASSSPLQGDAVKLDVPYFFQLDNRNEPHSTCGVTSASMLLNFYNKTPKPDDLYNRFGKETGQSPGGLASLYEAVLGSTSTVFSTYNGSFEDIKNFIRKGQPVVTHGFFTRSGHVLVIVGFNKEGFIVHDPYGVWLGNTSYDTSRQGRYLTYSYSRLRPVMGEDGDVWLSTASRPR